MASKIYRIEKNRRGRKSISEGTLEELIEYHGYTLLKGHSWNSKISQNPKTIKSLVLNLNRAVDAAAANGNGDSYYMQL